MPLSAHRVSPFLGCAEPSDLCPMVYQEQASLHCGMNARLLWHFIRRPHLGLNTRLEDLHVEVIALLFDSGTENVLTVSLAFMTLMKPTSTSSEP